MYRERKDRRYGPFRSHTRSQFQGLPSSTQISNEVCTPLGKSYFRSAIQYSLAPKKTSPAFKKADAVYFQARDSDSELGQALADSLAIELEFHPAEEKIPRNPLSTLLADTSFGKTLVDSLTLTLKAGPIPVIRAEAYGVEDGQVFHSISWVFDLLLRHPIKNDRKIFRAWEEWHESNPDQALAQHTNQMNTSN